MARRPGSVDAQWDVSNITQGGQAPASIVYDESSTPGALKIFYHSAGIPQTTMLLRKDETLEVGEYVKVDIAFAGGAASGNLRVGVGLASSRGRDANGGLDRSNVLYWGIRNDGLGRGHYYGASNTEIGDGGTSISGYTPGRFMTVAIRRISATTFSLYMAPTGQTLQLVTNFTYSGSTGAGEIVPAIPGIFLDNGLESFIAIVDNFKVESGWPPPVSPARPNAPQESIPLPANQISLDLVPDTGVLPQFQSTTHQVNFPQGNGDNTYHHGALLTKWKDKLYLAWHSTPQSEMTWPYTGMVSTSTNGETWTTPFDIGAATGNAAYESYVRSSLGIPAGEQITINAAPRNWHATESTLYLWSLGWVRRANGSTEGIGRIWSTTDGVTWQEMSPQSLNNLEQNSGLIIRDSGSNRGFVKLRDGRLMAATLGRIVPGGRISAPTTGDPTGLSGWSGGVIDTSDLADVGEPTAWEGIDGTLHFAARGNTGTVWHSFSADGGATWSKLQSMGAFSDSPGNKQFGTLSNGWNWYVGNPNPESRAKLMFSISRDGWAFDETFVVRDEPISAIWPAPFKTLPNNFYEYPAAYYDEAANTLYVAYSRTRDYMEITKVTGANLTPPVGDYNQDRVVSTVDHSLWKNQFGAAGGIEQPADGNQNGLVDAADYTLWRDNLGATRIPPTVPSSATSIAVATAATGPTIENSLVLLPLESKFNNTSFSNVSTRATSHAAELQFAAATEALLLARDLAFEMLTTADDLSEVEPSELGDNSSDETACFEFSAELRLKVR